MNVFCSDREAPEPIKGIGNVNIAVLCDLTLFQFRGKTYRTLLMQAFILLQPNKQKYYIKQ